MKFDFTIQLIRYLMRKVCHIPVTKKTGLCDNQQAETLHPKCRVVVRKFRNTMPKIINNHKSL